MRLTQFFASSFSAALVFILSFNAFAAEKLEDQYEQFNYLKQIDQCINNIMKTGLYDGSQEQLNQYCKVKVIKKSLKPGRYATRILEEKMTELNPFVITPHKPSYILPVVISDNFNRKPYDFVEEYARGMKEVESKYQVSFKIPLNTKDIFTRGDSFYFGMTIQAWWQLYSSEISKPFRETNYQPEIFYRAPLPWKPFGGNMGYSIALEHQSNGQSQVLSRSWNRIIGSIIYENGDYMFMFKPWHRIRENDKTDPDSPKGDDNPTIEDYMGNYSLYGAIAFNDRNKLTASIRKNWRTGNGAIELNYTYPLYGKLIGTVQYFSGYGESMIDYDHKQQKLGIGIALTEIF